MNRTDSPKKQAVPFGVNGQREDLLATTPAGDNTASYDAGFPPVTMILKAAGGLPPKGQDMNQILFELSSLARWSSSGALNTFDSAFSTAIGGYPKGAVLLNDAGTSIFISTMEANTNNPNTVTTGWLNLLSFLGGAPLASPTFTGDPKAPTPAAGDNDTSIATTAFVAAAIAVLGDGYLIPAGAPIPYFASTAPSGWILCNGATFSSTAYPKLAAAYPTLVLPDLRGNVIRGWDNGRGIDSGRVLLSEQTDALQNITAAVSPGFFDGNSATFTGAFASGSQTTQVVRGSASTLTQTAFTFDASRVARTATETRSRNIAFNYIVRAA